MWLTDDIMLEIGSESRLIPKRMGKDVAERWFLLKIASESRLIPKRV